MSRALGALVAAAAVATATGAASAHEVSSAPALVLVQRAPLQVRGVRFKPHESVLVRAVTPNDRTHTRARTTRRGRFMASFGHFVPGPCLRLVITAVGAKGDHATLIVDPPRQVEIPCRI